MYSIYYYLVNLCFFLGFLRVAFDTRFPIDKETIP